MAGPFASLGRRKRRLRAGGARSCGGRLDGRIETSYPALPGYTASKWGVRGLTKAVALDLGKYDIRVNSVHPGVIRTPMTSAIPEDTRHVAMDRTADPNEIANLVLFLASDESSFSTGAEFIADGGETAGLVANPPRRPA